MTNEELLREDARWGINYAAWAAEEIDMLRKVIADTGKVIGDAYTGYPKELPDSVAVALERAKAQWTKA